MPKGIYKRTEKHKLSLKVPRKGSGIYKRTPETIEQLKKQGKIYGFKKGHIGYKSMLNKKLSEQQRQKIREAHLNKPRLEETKRKISETRKKLHQQGKLFSKKHRENLSKALTGNSNISGKKSRFWRGGITYDPYSVDWTGTLKRSIRERDKYICGMCGSLQGDRAFPVHHIDYDKLNSNPENLITLCAVCHAKTNQNRNYWIKYFNKNE